MADTRAARINWQAAPTGTGDILGGDLYAIHALAYRCLEYDNQGHIPVVEYI
jgi:hypothetical protein